MMRSKSSASPAGRSPCLGVDDDSVERALLDVAQRLPALRGVRVVLRHDLDDDLGQHLGVLLALLFAERVPPLERDPRRIRRPNGLVGQRDAAVGRGRDAAPFAPFVQLARRLEGAIAVTKRRRAHAERSVGLAFDVPAGVVGAQPKELVVVERSCGNDHGVSRRAYHALHTRA